MIYSATVIKAGTEATTWVVQPHRTQVDGKPYAQLPALATEGIKPQLGDIVICAQSENNFTHDYQQEVNDNGGACPVIIGVFSTTLLKDAIIHILRDLIVDGTSHLIGNVTLGEGTSHMVLGEGLAAWAQNIDTWASTISAWGATGTGAAGSIPPYTGGPPSETWVPDNLSEKHKLD